MRMDANIPDSGPLLEAVLEGFVQASMLILQSGAVPLFPSQAGVRFQAEHGTEHWQLPHETLKLGYGDCEDLAMWEAAGYRVSGMDPGASVLLVQTATNALHAIVQLSDGSHSDPSLRLMHPTQAQKQGLAGQLHLAADAGPGGGVFALGDGGVVIHDHRSDDVRKQLAAADPTGITADMLKRGVTSASYGYGGPTSHPDSQAILDQVTRIHQAAQDAMLSDPKMIAFADANGRLPSSKADYAAYNKQHFAATRDPSSVKTADQAYASGLIWVDDGYTPGHFERPSGGMDPLNYAQSQYGGTNDPNDPLDMQYGYPGYGYPNYPDPGFGGYSPFYPQGMSPFDYSGANEGAYGWQSGNQQLMTYQDLYPQDFQQGFPAMALPGAGDTDVMMENE